MRATRFWILDQGQEKLPPPWPRYLPRSWTILFPFKFLRILRKGTLGKLGKPGYVTGSDLSKVMVDYCQEKYRLENLEFRQLDVTDGLDFGEAHCSKFSLVTSFCCLQWVCDHPAATSLTHKVLRKGGKFMHLVSVTLKIGIIKQRSIKVSRWSQRTKKSLLPNF